MSALRTMVVHLSRAMALAWPEGGRAVVARAVQNVADALGLYHDLRDGISPAGPEGLASALQVAAYEVTEYAKELVRLLPGCDPDEAADESARRPG